MNLKLVGLLFHVNLCAGRMIAPVIKNWSEEFPHVTTYKIDIDEVLRLLPLVISTFYDLDEIFMHCIFVSTFGAFYC